MKLLTKEQVDALFGQEAVLLGTQNMVPAFRAKALFGDAAVSFAFRMDSNRKCDYSNGYGIGDYTIMTLTYRGFQAAASFYNAQLLKNMSSERVAKRRSACISSVSEPVMEAQPNEKAN